MTDATEADDDVAPFIPPARIMDRKAQRVPIGAQNGRIGTQPVKILQSTLPDPARAGWDPKGDLKPNKKSISNTEKQKLAEITALKKSREAYEAKKTAAAVAALVEAPSNFDGIRQISRAPTVGFEPGPRPQMQWIEVDALDVDHAYQRPLSSKHAKRLAIEFKWLSFQPLSVTPKPNGHYAVVDGQHRLQACKAIPQITKVPCYVVPAASQQAQAHAFVEINDSHKRVTGLEKFRAALVARDPITMSVAKACEDAGLKIVAGQTLAPMTTASPALLVSLCRTHGIAPVRRGIGLMAIAWRKEGSAFSYAVMNAVILTCRYAGESATDDAILAFMGKIEPAIYEAEQAALAKRAGTRRGSSLLTAFFQSITGREFSR